MGASTHSAPPFIGPERVAFLLLRDPTLPRDVGEALALAVGAIYRHSAQTQSGPDA